MEETLKCNENCQEKYSTLRHELSQILTYTENKLKIDLLSTDCLRFEYI